MNRLYSAFKQLFVDEVNDEAAVEANSKLLRPLFLALLLAGGAVVVVLALDLAFGPQSDSKLGPFGDFFGGMLNPVFTFLTFFGLIITIVIQRMELRLARDEYSKTAVALNTQAVERSRPRFARPPALPPSSPPITSSLRHPLSQHLISQHKPSS